MAGATNTIIQILRSDVTAYPTSLNPGEQAYSYVSDKLFVGNTTNGVITIGGKYYVDLIDNATSANTGNTLVRRDNAGNAAFKMVTVADDASNGTDVVNKSYLDSRIGALSSNTIFDGIAGQDGYSNVFVSSTAGGGSIGIVANNTTVATITKNITTFVQDVGITGNLVVTGTTSYTNVQSLLVSNNDIVLNANAAGYPLINAYITVNRGTEDNAAIIWNEATDRWQIDRATGTTYDIIDTAGGQSISGTTTLDSASVTNGLHAGSIETSGSANVASLQANGAIYADQIYVTANVQLANVANVAYYANILQATGSGTNKHYVMLSDNGSSGNTRIQANTLFSFDTANTTMEVGYSTYTPLPNTMYQGTGSSYAYVQNNLQNLNNEGSADWVATADNGSDTDGYIDMGIGGGNYDYLTDAGEVGPFRPNDGWIQVVGNTGIGKGNLVIMTGTSNTSVAEVGSIIFSVGNQAYSNIAGYISRQSNSPTGALTWAINKVPGTSSANYNYKLDVNGSANVASLYINSTQVLGESFALPVSFGGTGLQSVTANAVIFGNGTGAFGVTNAPSAGQVLQYRTDGVKFGGLDGGTF
jgi:hypothetical protein